MASSTNIKIKKELTRKEKRIILITVLYNNVIEGGKRGKADRRRVRRILACAKEEFLEKGFSEASLRSIAAKADTTTGSIYSRYGGKEELFGEIVEPAAEYLIAMFTRTQENFHAMDVEEQPKKMEGTVQNGMHEMLDYIYENFETFELLLDASYGTKFQHFVECLVEIETKYTYRYMEDMHMAKQTQNVITEDFVHIMTTALFESIFEVVRHKMTKEDAIRYIDMLSLYHYAGWDAILQISEK